MVVNEGATNGLIDHPGYRVCHDVENPISSCRCRSDMRAYASACGQSLAARGVSREELAPGIGVALSAITAILHPEAEGLRLLQ